ncbi:MAG: hypothetical protein VKJ86_02045 [Synechococcus sp.]|nr:hypothetical protein [Synechococcus sp.]
MTHKTYGISPAKIGNQDGFRFPRAFSRDYPHLVNASGEVEVLDEKTLLVRLDPAPTAADEDASLMMGLFLEFLMHQVVEQPETLVPYTEEMSQELDALLAGVTVEA